MVLPIFLKQDLEVKTTKRYDLIIISRRVIYSFDNVSVGYTLTKTNSNSTMKLILTAQNVLVITKYSGLDPEIAGGIDNNLYPRPITFTLGLNVNF
jgi:iron complex outermembrane receptor protein